MANLIWFREDLRIDDNTALHAATQADNRVAGIFLLTPHLWQRHSMAHIRIQFLIAGLEQLSHVLKKKNIALKIITVTSDQQIPKILYQYAKHMGANQLFFNNQYEVNEIQRDQAVHAFFTQQGLSVYRYDDQIIFPKGKIHTQAGEPFKVFTPFKKAWFKYAYQYGIPSLLPTLKKQTILLEQPTKMHFKRDHRFDLTTWPAGEIAALSRLQNFIETKLSHYHETRDFPALNGTSRLSPYLSTGMLSPRRCFHAALEFNHGEFDSGNRGAITWINELIWREFYKNILISFPHVSKNKPFKLEADQIKWSYNKKLLHAWQQGMTGYPFVDAGMRQLNSTGWMHNRLRMVVAMFLSKTLFLDWRLGEQYFIEHLIDGDLAANNGGWQWSASTGVDAAPYFRIFNPLRQSQHFDPNGEFIRRYCPELTHLDNRAIHEPHKYQNLLGKPLDYPLPIIDQAAAKKRVIVAFKQILRKKSASQ